MTGRSGGPPSKGNRESPEFIESLARGLAVIGAFRPEQPRPTLVDLARVTGLPRPTIHRILMTLAALGYVRTDAGAFDLTPRVLDLGMAYVRSQGLWDAARPHMERLTSSSSRSCSIAQLVGPDIVYVGRVEAPNAVGLRVRIGVPYPAVQTSHGQVLLAALPQDVVDRVVAQPSRAQVVPARRPGRNERSSRFSAIRARGWAVCDRQLSAEVRSVAVPLRDGSGDVVAAVDVECYAGELSAEEFLDRYLPPVLCTAADIGAELANRQSSAGPVPSWPVKS